MSDELVTGADRREVDRQVLVIQRRKSPEGSRKQEGPLNKPTKSDADVAGITPASNPVQETESSLELSRMSIISSDCMRLPIVPVDQKVKAEELQVWP